MFFSGSSSNKKIELRGKSKGEETRQQIVERTRHERELRRQQKLESKSATIISACWRGRLSRIQTRAHCRASWIQTHRISVSMADSCLQPQSDFLRGLLHFVDVRREADVALLGEVCDWMLQRRGPGLSPLLSPMQQAGHDRAVVLLRLQRMAALALKALTMHRHAFRPLLSRPRSPLPPPISSTPSTSTPNPAFAFSPSTPLTPNPNPAFAFSPSTPSTPNPAVSLAEILLLLINPDAYAPTLGPTLAPVAAASLTRSLADSGMAHQLYLLLSATAPLPSPPPPQPPQHQQPAQPAQPTQPTQPTQQQQSADLPPTVAARIQPATSSFLPSSGTHAQSAAASPAGAEPSATINLTNDMEVDEDTNSHPAPRSTTQTTSSSAPLLAVAAASHNSAGSCSSSSSSNAHGGSNGSGGKALVETLATQLIVRTLSLRHWVPRSAPASLDALLFVPQLWERAGSLQPIAGRLARQAVASLAALDAGGFATRLPGEGEGGKAGALAVLLGNIVTVGGRMLSVDSRPVAAATPGVTAPPAPSALASAATAETALHLVTVLQRTLALLPTHPFFSPTPLSTNAPCPTQQQPPPSSNGSSTTAAQPPPATADPHSNTIPPPPPPPSSAAAAAAAVAAAAEPPGSPDDDEPTESATAGVATAALQQQPRQRLQLPLQLRRGERLPASVVASARLLLEPPGRELLRSLVLTLLPAQSASEMALLHHAPDPVVGLGLHRPAAPHPAQSLPPTPPNPPPTSGHAEGPRSLSPAHPSGTTATPPPGDHHPQQHGSPLPSSAAAAHTPPSSVAAAHTPPSSVAAAHTPPSSTAAAHTPPSSTTPVYSPEGAYRLCQLIRQLISLPGQRELLLLSLSVSAQLVQRLWYNMLRVGRENERRGGGVTHASSITPHTAGSAGAQHPRAQQEQQQQQQQGMAAASDPTGHGTSGQAALDAMPQTAGHASSGQTGGNAVTLGASQRQRQGQQSAWWQPVGDSCADPGWILPLSIACSAFASHVSTSSLEGVVSAGRPIPLQQIFDPAQPRADPAGALRRGGSLAGTSPTCVLACGVGGTVTGSLTLCRPCRCAAAGRVARRNLADLCAGAWGFLALLRDSLWQVLWSDVERTTTASASSSSTALALIHGSSSSSSSSSAAAAAGVRQPAVSAAALLRTEFASSAGRLYGQLYDRNSRRPFCPPEAFTAEGLVPERFMQEASGSRLVGGGVDGGARVWRLLRCAPGLVPFQERARLFQGEVSMDRQVYREAEFNSMEQLQEGNRFVTIRRRQLLFDGFDRLSALGEALKGRVRIQFVSEHGEPEAGVDGGGLFKDFLAALMKEGFSTQYGLFLTNPAHQLYPNPGAVGVVEDAGRLLEFLGRMLGKAMYEGILVELPFAGFFLKKLRGGYCDLQDMPTLDPEVARNLSSLATYRGDVAELSLTFSITDSVFGEHREVELKPDGRSIAVTHDNVMEYIHRVAEYRLNTQLRPAVGAFLGGLFSIIRPEWVSMFNDEELQVLISGSEEGLDVADMAAHVAYAGGYHEEHPVIIAFWEAVESFTTEQQRELLKFVTACSRAPLLGFRYLEPQLCIQMAGGMLDAGAVGRLPTAATCMNLLKLPPYRSVQVMREKLLYAIQSGAGFDLS
ncbi:MAG: hypothetical protein WDW36_000459 [Sanguina aurantia]